MALHSPIGSSSIENLISRLDGLFQDSNYQPFGGDRGWNVFDPRSQCWADWGQIRNTYDKDLILIQKEIYKYLIAKKEEGSWRLYLDRFSHDPLWAKWAVIQSCANVGQYLPKVNGWEFIISHGLPLPIELHRVCCLCSGFLPYTHSGGTRYLNVPPVIQFRILKQIALPNYP
jgi:hypothetical protein